VRVQRAQITIPYSERIICASWRCVHHTPLSFLRFLSICSTRITNTRTNQQCKFVMQFFCKCFKSFEHAKKMSRFMLSHLLRLDGFIIVMCKVGLEDVQSSSSLRVYKFTISEKPEGGHCSYTPLFHQCLHSSPPQKMISFPAMCYSFMYLWVVIKMRQSCSKHNPIIQQTHDWTIKDHEI
jgi:hypothetical protein